MNQNFLFFHFSDSVPHVPNDELNWSYVYSLIRNTTALLVSTYPLAEHIPTLGNHDAFPANQVPMAPDSYYGTLLKDCFWQHMIKDKEGEHQFRQGFYYLITIFI